MDGQTDRCRQDRQTDRQMDGWKHRQAGKQTDVWMDRKDTTDG